MYHEETYQRKAQRRRRILWMAVIAVIACALIWLAATSASANAREQAAVSVRQTILDTAMQACAIEGAYPASLQYLEEEYGLVVNHADYIINYEIFAPNVAPTVEVVPR